MPNSPGVLAPPSLGDPLVSGVDELCDRSDTEQAESPAQTLSLPAQMPDLLDANWISSY